MSQHLCGGQRTLLRSWSSLVPSWNLGVELRLPGLDAEPSLAQNKDIFK